ncbi:MAG: molybdopterin-guanine dinucleotide biosynthesis protein A [Rhodobacterales bacterium RIFCSPHIGHO2_02_FULL_62_130]|nr:MAG: molybdopterin-guanine dinucleotide biosynthesis protein A [Rhodobacterales bacterium RIFCSPHIGHO2_02_FULL_62_130]OHC56468.1 MAG: molybdopterin-guanine dinucleotide biosynthesis protein A [Rhodobacterales bacterium RIFCSPHIGHO2_12_FULL_62_75]
MKPAILILAAGASSRMRGGDKLLEVVDGVPQLARSVQAALATGARVLVALPPDRPARSEALAGFPVDLFIVPDAAEGMAASIRAGVARADGAAGLMMLPADMPELQADDLAAVIAGFDSAPDRIWRGAAMDGRAGHPVIFPAQDFAELATLRGDAGARAVLQANAARINLIALPDQRALIDLDTPEDWAAWRKAR